MKFTKKNSSPFQYYERTIASTELNNTSKESSDIQLFAAGKIKGVALSGGRGSLMIMPRPLSGCQIKAEIKDFLLM